MSLEYVVAYAWVVDKKVRKIPLVLKDRPDYLKGMLNLPGGKIEEDENVIEAAIRELKEETGLEDLNTTDGMCPYSSEYMGKVIDQCRDYIIHCVKIPITFRQKIKPRVEETEKANWYNAVTLFNDSRLMPNLRLVIPLMDAGLKGWTIVSSGDLRGYSCKMEVIVPGIGSFEKKE